MPDIDSMIKTQRIMCIKRYLAPYSAGWKLFLDFHLKNAGGKFLFHCNFDYAKLSVAVPEFYNESIILLSSLNSNSPLQTLDDIVN